MNQPVFSLQTVELISLLDRTVDLAEGMKLSEHELIERLVERYHQKTDRCRTKIHLNRDSQTERKTFDGTAGP